MRIPNLLIVAVHCIHAILVTDVACSWGGFWKNQSAKVIKMYEPVGGREVSNGHSFVIPQDSQDK